MIEHDQKSREYSQWNHVYTSMVAFINCQFAVQIDRLAKADGHWNFCSYHPENFSGLVNRIPVPKVTLLIFQSGNIVMTGAKSIDELIEAAEYIEY